MQKTCQKIVRVQDGRITEIFDGLVARSFSDNDKALKDLLLDDIGLDFQGILETYERLLLELAQTHQDNLEMLKEYLPEGWLEWAEETYAAGQEEDKRHEVSVLK
ncbi:hypothetical protein RAC89_03200 [Paenibacillus sp. GD4]|jgi:hypothetical protein|uniref:hypothetical protein n=1 Tax=Paenibacillus TaxID=44249 RepID=UPI002542958E|nr:MULTISPECIES: hypothetical protein [Paenibacillus]MDQ1909509.1 hypothetical protein [Paenibacillus sp. GD4]